MNYYKEDNKFDIIDPIDSDLPSLTQFLLAEISSSFAAYAGSCLLKYDAILIHSAIR